MQHLDRTEYEKSLMRRVGEAAPLETLEVHMGDWSPQENMCHHNVTKFCDSNPDYIPVRGWLYFDLPGLNVAKFLSHSVVRAPNGTLYDITPSNATARYPFLAANLTADEYAELVEVQGVSELHPQKLVE